MQDAIYVVFSSTPYRIGKLIRKLTAERYNHVSLALDEDLPCMYGFARRYYRTPLYGGFVRESLSRYHVNGKPSLCMICRIPVSAAQYASLNMQMEEMYAHKEQYLYNHLSVWTLPFRKRVHVQDARLCVEFVADILSRLDTPVKKGRFYTVGDLRALLEPYAVYEGTMPAPTAYDEDYFARKPVPHPFISSIRDIIALFSRLEKASEKAALK